MRQFKVNGYTFKGSNADFVIFSSLLKGGITQKRSEQILMEQGLAFYSRPHCEWTSLPRKDNRKSGK